MTILIVVARPGFLAPGEGTGRRLLLSSVGSWIAAGASAAQAQSVFSTDKWDGSFLDSSKDCKEVLRQKKMMIYDLHIDLLYRKSKRLNTHISRDEDVWRRLYWGPRKGRVCGTAMPWGAMPP